MHTYVDLLCLFLNEIVCLTGYFAGRCLPTCRPGSSSPESDLSYRCASAVHVVRRHAKSLRITPDSTQQEQSFKAYVLSVLGMKRNFLDFVGVALLLLRESQSTVGRKRKSTSHWQNSSASDSKAFTSYLSRLLSLRKEPKECTQTSQGLNGSSRHKSTSS